MLEMMTKTAVDMIQSAKKTAIDTFVKHEGLAKTLNQFVDDQTTYTKKFVTSAYEMSSDLANTLSKKDFYAEALDAYRNEISSWLPNKKEKK